MDAATTSSAPSSVVRAVICAAALFLTVGVLLGYMQHRTFVTQQNQVVHDTVGAQTMMRLHLDSHRDYLQLLATEMAHGVLDAGTFRRYTEQYVTDHPELVTISWADADFVTRWSVPFEPNRQVIDLPLSLSELQRAAHLAYETRHPVYTRPFVAAQGQPRFEVYVPVFRGDEFLGTFRGIYSMQKVLRHILAPSVAHRYQLSLLDTMQAVIAGVAGDRRVDTRLRRRVSLSPPGHGLVLQLTRYKTEPDGEGLVVTLLVIGLAFGLVWGLWRTHHQIAERQQSEAARKAAEEALRRQRDWLDVTLSSVGDAVIATDTHGAITFMNRAAESLTEWPAEEAVGRPIDEVAHMLHEQTRQPLETPVSRVFEADAPVASTNHTVLMTRHGREVAIANSGAPIYDCHRKLYGVVLVFRDITESKQLQRQMQQAQKMQAIGTLAGGIAHEFNNLLTAILGFTDLTRQEVPQGSKAWQNLHAVLTAGRRARDLVQQILDFSRHGESKLVPVSFHLTIREALGLLRATLPSSLELRQHLDEDVGMVSADRTQLHQILMNLCANAEHAMRETGGILEVRVDTVEVEALSDLTDLRPGSYARLTVRDTGQGMEPCVQERIFEPFFTTKDVGEGTGMGMAIVHGIVSSHGGAITVESMPGRGTTVAVYFPRMVEATGRDPGSGEPAPHGTECILFVDDEATIGHMAQTMLTQLGYQAVVCTKSVEALEVFTAAPQRFDLVVTDQTMPGMSGVALTRELRQIRPDIPIVLCTGFSRLIDATRAQMLGIDAFLMKPIGFKDLALAVRQGLSRQRVGNR